MAAVGGRIFRPRYALGRYRVHHGFAGQVLVAAGVALVIHDWVAYGDHPILCFRSFFSDRKEDG